MHSPALSAGVASGSHLRGIGLMLLAILMFSLNDVLGKWLVATYSVSQVLFIRSGAALLVLLPFVIRVGRDAFVQMEQPWLQAFRVVLGTFEVALFYLAVSYLPLADAMTFYMAGPIYVTALSALLLGETVGKYRWAAVLVGFGGVVIALQPSSSSLGIGSLISILASLFFALLMVTTRHLRRTPNTVLVATQIAASFVFGGVTVPWTWVPPSATDLLLLALLGIVAVAAFALVNTALKIAPASVTVPFQYTILVWALVFGYLFFGDLPQAHTVIGAAVIVAAGLFIFVREQHKAQTAPA